MSANTFTLTCVGDEAALSVLHDKLQSAIAIADSNSWPAPLDTVFDGWDSPSILSASVRGATLRCMIDTSTRDDLELAQIVALHAAGVEYLRVNVFNSQVGESATSHYHEGKQIKAKAFPKLELSESERLYALVDEGNDTALAKVIKSGASVDAVIDGVPLLVHALRQGMERSVRAMADATVDMERCLPWAPEMAKLIQDYAGGKRLALLTALLEHPAADLPALARSVQVMCAVCVHPKLLKWLLAQPGVDASARLYRDENGQREEMGSLLFHSVEFFEDRDDILKVLYAAGARSVLMSHMPAPMRLDRTLCGYRDADTPAELVAAGIDLDQHIWSGEYPILRLCLRNYTDTQRELQLIAELMDMGASVHYWMDPETFQVEVLEQIFSAYWQENEFENEEGICLDEGHATGIVSVFRRLLERGLEANMSVSFGASDVTERSPAELHYEGSLIGAIAFVLCGRGSRQRRLCLPLVELLLAHGADSEATGHLHVDPNGKRSRRILVDSDELATGAPWSEPSSILALLRQRNAEDFDEIDAAVIAAMTRTTLANTQGS